MDRAPSLERSGQTCPDDKKGITGPQGTGRAENPAHTQVSFMR